MTTYKQTIIAASFENCLRLEKLSNWTDTLHCYEAYSDWHPTGGEPELKRRDSRVMHKSSYVHPAYDASYLLRRLPPLLKMQAKTEPPRHLLLIQLGTEHKVWMAAYAATDEVAALLNPKLRDYDLRLGSIVERALTAEDALARLAIELFKRGVLSEDQATK